MKPKQVREDRAEPQSRGLWILQVLGIVKELRYILKPRNEEDTEDTL